MEKLFDIKYGDDPMHTLDLYLPSGGKGPFPLVVFIHGGGWQIGDKRDGQENSWKILANSGYAVASLNYRLAPVIKHPEGIIDCKEALKFLRENADRFKLDMKNVAVTGSSSGGHYALMLATTVDNPLFNRTGKPDVPIKCCVTWYAPTDFVAGKRNASKSIINRIKYGAGIICVERYFRLEYKNLKNDLLREGSPAAYIDKNLPPVLLQQGDADFINPVDQAHLFKEAARKKGVGDQVTVEIFKGAKHMDNAFNTQANRLRCRKFLDRHLKNKWEGHPGTPPT